MSSDLPFHTSVGDKLTMVPYELSKPAHGVVVSIPRHRRFAVVEFNLDTMGLYGVRLRRRIRECVYLSPAR